MKNDLIEIIEYWNVKEEVYEIMLSAEFYKKQRGEEYTVLNKSNISPFAIMEDRKDIEWVAQKQLLEPNSPRLTK